MNVYHQTETSKKDIEHIRVPFEAKLINSAFINFQFHCISTLLMTNSRKTNYLFARVHLLREDDTPKLI